MSKNTQDFENLTHVFKPTTKIGPRQTLDNKSRKNASSLSFKASCLKEVSQKSLAFELQSFIFEGSLAEKLRFWTSKLHFWRKSPAKALFLSFKAWFSKEVSQKSFAFEFPSFIFDFHIHWISNQVNLTPSEPRIEWLANQLNLKPNDPLNDWTSKELNLKSIESHHWDHTSQINCSSIQLNWNQRNLKSIDNQITWNSNQLTTKSCESQDQLTTKSLESQINWQPNPLKIKSINNQMTWNSNQLTTISNQWNLKSQSSWISNQLNFKTLESEINWLSNQLNSTPSSYRYYRCLIFGNFRHRLVR